MSSPSTPIPWLIHRPDLSPHQPPEPACPRLWREGTITTPFDMTVLNDLDRFHLVMDTIDRLPQTGEKGIYLKQQPQGKTESSTSNTLIMTGQDLPEIRNWKWSNPK